MKFVKTHARSWILSSSAERDATICTHVGGTTRRYGDNENSISQSCYMAHKCWVHWLELRLWLQMMGKKRQKRFGATRWNLGLTFYYESMNLAFIVTTNCFCMIMAERFISCVIESATRLNLKVSPTTSSEQNCEVQLTLCGWNYDIANLTTWNFTLRNQHHVTFEPFPAQLPSSLNLWLPINCRSCQPRWRCDMQKDLPISLRLDYTLKRLNIKRSVKQIRH